MKNIKLDIRDSLRAEYKRSDFGEMVRGKHAQSQVDFVELVRILLACIAEDEGLKFIYLSKANCLTGRERGDWTYEIDNANQVTLRYWVSEFASLKERISNPPDVTTRQLESDLQNLLMIHVRALKDRVNAL